MAGERVEGVRIAVAPDGSAEPQLIAARLRQGAAAASPPHLEHVSAFSVEEWMDGDAGHLHRAGDLTAVPVVSHRRLGGRVVVPLKRIVRRLLFPLLDIQTSVNVANARVVTFLLRQLSAQARSIEELEQEVARLRAERDP